MKKNLGNFDKPNSRVSYNNELKINEEDLSRNKGVSLSYNSLKKKIEPIISNVDQNILNVIGDNVKFIENLTTENRPYNFNKDSHYFHTILNGITKDVHEV